MLFLPARMTLLWSRSFEAFAQNAWCFRHHLRPNFYSCVWLQCDLANFHQTSVKLYFNQRFCVPLTVEERITAPQGCSLHGNFLITPTHSHYSVVMSNCQ